jgi:hypothetical protein
MQRVTVEKGRGVPTQKWRDRGHAPRGRLRWRRPRRLRPTGRTLSGHRRHPGLHEGRLRSRGRSEGKPRPVAVAARLPARRHRCSATRWVSRWRPSRPLRRSAQAESDAIGRCGRRTSVRHPRSSGRGPCRSQPALSGVGKRNRVKSFGCVRGDGVRGVPVLQMVARIDERRQVAELPTVAAEGKRSGLVRRGKPQGTKRRRERGALDALHGIAERALTGSSFEDRRSGARKSLARSPGQRQKRSRLLRLTGSLRARRRFEVVTERQTSALSQARAVE